MKICGCHPLAVTTNSYNPDTQCTLPKSVWQHLCWQYNNRVATMHILQETNPTSTHRNGR